MYKAGSKLRLFGYQTNAMPAKVISKQVHHIRSRKRLELSATEIISNSHKQQRIYAYYDDYLLFKSWVSMIGGVNTHHRQQNDVNALSFSSMHVAFTLMRVTKILNFCFLVCNSFLLTRSLLPPSRSLHTHAHTG